MYGSDTAFSHACRKLCGTTEHFLDNSVRNGMTNKTGWTRRHENVVVCFNDKNTQMKKSRSNYHQLKTTILMLRCYSLSLQFIRKHTRITSLKRNPKIRASKVSELKVTTESNTTITLPQFPQLVLHLVLAIVLDFQLLRDTGDVCATHNSIYSKSLRILIFDMHFTLQ